MGCLSGKYQAKIANRQAFAWMCKRMLMGPSHRAAEQISQRSLRLGFLFSALCITACAPEVLGPAPGNSQMSLTPPDAQSNHSVDLLIRSTAAPNPVKSGQPVTYILSISNISPASPEGSVPAASDVKVSFSIAAGAVLVGTPFGDGWSCQTQQTLVTCIRAAVTHGLATDIVITAIPDIGDGTSQAVAQVTAGTDDPDLGNNSATTTVNINFDPAGYKQPVLGGGGFGCSYAAETAPLGFGNFGALFLAALWRYRRQPRKSKAFRGQS